MAFLVQLTEDAARDLAEIYDYLDHHHSPAKATDVLGQIESRFLSLSEYPGSGSYSKELLELGIQEYREVLCDPYRIIYRVLDQHVYVLVIADGRRDMQTLLQRRLLQA
jgi:toxin ParE1/3/4